MPYYISMPHPLASCISLPPDSIHVLRPFTPDGSHLAFHSIDTLVGAELNKVLDHPLFMWVVIGSYNHGLLEPISSIFLPKRCQ